MKEKTYYYQNLIPIIGGLGGKKIRNLLKLMMHEIPLLPGTSNGQLVGKRK
jgi:hypothetical protein